MSKRSDRGKGRDQFRSKTGTAPVIVDRHTAFGDRRVPAGLILFLILIIGVAIYFNSFRNEFVFDDDIQVANNAIIKSFKNIPDIFTHNLGYYGGEKDSKFYRPVQTLTYMVDYFLGGLDPFGYHITNTLLHIAVCMLLFYLIFNVTANRLLSSLVVLIYLVHPVHTEAVTYISGRADSLSSIFLLTMMIFQFKYWNSGTRSRKAIYYLVILISFLLALLSKELSMIFPILLMFTEYCFRNRERYEGLLNKRAVFYIPLVIIVVAWFLVKNTVVPTEAMVSSSADLKLAVSLRAVPKIIFNYIKISFLPFDLHMEYKLPFPRSIFQEAYFGPFVFILGFFPFLCYLWKKGRADINYRIMFFGLGWFTVALMPYLNIFFHLNASFSEHWLYIPEMGLLLFIIYFLLYNAQKAKMLGKPALLFCLILIAGFSFLTVRQNTVWKDKFTFYTYTLKQAPHSAKTCNNLAVEYIKRRDFAKAKELLERAIKLEPQYDTAIENLRNLNM